jgi:hypothetical protein
MEAEKPKEIFFLCFTKHWKRERFVDYGFRHMCKTFCCCLVFVFVWCSIAPGSPDSMVIPVSRWVSVTSRHELFQTLKNIPSWEVPSFDPDIKRQLCPCTPAVGRVLCYALAWFDLKSSTLSQENVFLTVCVTIVNTWHSLAPGALENRTLK